MTHFSYCLFANIIYRLKVHIIYVGSAPVCYAQNQHTDIVLNGLVYTLHSIKHHNRLMVIINNGGEMQLLFPKILVIFVLSEPLLIYQQYRSIRGKNNIKLPSSLSTQEQSKHNIS